MELVEHVVRPDEVEEVPAMHKKHGAHLRQVQRATRKRVGQVLARRRAARRKRKKQVRGRRAKVRAEKKGRHAKKINAASSPGVAGAPCAQCGVCASGVASSGSAQIS